MKRAILVTLLFACVICRSVPADETRRADPELALRTLMKKKIWRKSETKYILQALKDIPYGKWRDYDPEETIRFYALRLREVRIIKTPPEEFIARHTDWTMFNQLKKDFRITW